LAGIWSGPVWWVAGRLPWWVDVVAPVAKCRVLGLSALPRRCALRGPC
jgi:hypothetical protein